MNEVEIMKKKKNIFSKLRGFKKFKNLRIMIREKIPADKFHDKKNFIKLIKELEWSEVSKIGLDCSEGFVIIERYPGWN